MNNNEKLDMLMGRNKPTYHEIYFAISNSNIGGGGYSGIIVNCEDNLIDFFNGNLLEDNITEEKTIPTVAGFYKAKLYIKTLQCNHPQDPVEYDTITKLEDVELIYETFITEENE